MRSKIDARQINRLIDEEIIRYWNTEPEAASINQIYRALSFVIREAAAIAIPADAEDVTQLASAFV